MSEKAIRAHYEVALKLIDLKQLDKAKHELYNKMPGDLYDASLDLMYNRNLKIKNDELKTLITEVHQLLLIEEVIKDEDNPMITDDDLKDF